MDETIDYSNYDEYYTYEELKSYVDNNWKKMSDEEKLWRSMMGGIFDPSLHEHVLYCTKPGDKIVINERTHKFKVIK